MAYRRRVRTDRSGREEQGGGGDPPAVDPNLWAWNLINLSSTTRTDASNGSGVTVGVFDGYTNCNHSELAGRCTNLPYSGVRYRADSHGTHVAGTVAGKTYGVARSATILNVPVFSSTGWVAYGTRLIDGWAAAANRGATVVNMSFGCTNMALCFYDSELSAMAGANSSSLLFVKAAGNDGVNMINESTALSAATAQAAMDRLILVGSVGSSSTISWFSNRPGSNCLLASGQSSCTSELMWKNHFIVAPGENIYSSLPSGAGYMSGTSMATPIVSGVAALVEARWPDLKSQPEVVAQILFETATDLGAAGIDEVYGWGMVNAGQAMQPLGATNVHTSTGLVPVSGTIQASIPSMPGIASLLRGVTAYDRVGRDFKLAEIASVSIDDSAPVSLLSDLLASQAMLDGNEDNEALQPGRPAFRMAIGPSGNLGSVGLREGDAGLRMAMDYATGDRAAVHLRLSGASSARADMLADPVMRPLGYFASSALQTSSVTGAVSLRLSPRQRIVAYGARSMGSALAPGWARTLVRRPGYDLGEAEPDGSQTGVGLFWSRVAPRSYLHVATSLFRQSGRAYDGSWSLGGNARPVQMLNAGVALGRRVGPVLFHAAGEISRLNSSRAASLVYFDGLSLLSLEAGLRVALGSEDPGAARQHIGFGARMAPRAVAGGVAAEYLAPSGAGGAALLKTSSLSGAALMQPLTMLTVGYSYEAPGLRLALTGGRSVEGLRQTAFATTLGFAF